MHRKRQIALWLLSPLLLQPLRASTKVLVTVVEQKSGRPVTGLKAEDFTVLDEKTPRQVESAEYASAVLDAVLLLDTSLVGSMVQPVAEDLIAQLKPKEQMAIVAFHSSADLIQDFTSSKQLLGRAIGSVTYGNTPRVLDALYAAIDTGMKNATFRRVVVILTTGYEGDSRTSERDVAQLARKSGVSIYPVFATGRGRALFEHLARRKGGAGFYFRGMREDSGGGGAR